MLTIASQPHTNLSPNFILLPHILEAAMALIVQNNVLFNLKNQFFVIHLFFLATAATRNVVIELNSDWSKVKIVSSKLEENRSQSDLSDFDRIVIKYHYRYRISVTTTIGKYLQRFIFSFSLSLSPSWDWSLRDNLHVCGFTMQQTFPGEIKGIQSMVHPLICSALGISDMGNNMSV